MAAPRRYGCGLVRFLLGAWQLGPYAAREQEAPLRLLVGCQKRFLSCLVGSAFSGPRLALASRSYGQGSALDRFLGFSQVDSSPTSVVPAVSMNRGKGLQ